MNYETFSKIVETCDKAYVDKLCNDGWYLICTKPNLEPAENETEFVYSFGQIKQIF